MSENWDIYKDFFFIMIRQRTFRISYLNLFSLIQNPTRSFIGHGNTRRCLSEISTKKQQKHGGFSSKRFAELLLHNYDAIARSCVRGVRP